MADNNTCVDVLFESTFRQLRADPLDFGPRLNLSVKCTWSANRSVSAVSFLVR